MLRFIKLLIAILILSCTPSLYAQETASGKVTQAGTFIGMVNGVYNGSTTFKQLLGYGDFGLGTENGVPGELVINQGKVYISDGTGKVTAVPPSAKTPYTMIVKFKPDHVYQLKNIANLQAFEKTMDPLLPSKNLFYAMKVTGTFNITGRVFPAPEKGTILSDWIKQHQTIVHLDKVPGTVIIFRSPDYASPITVPGYHLHFISNDKQHVYHLYDVSFDKATVAVQTLTNYTLLLPTTKDYAQANLQELGASTIVDLEHPDVSKN